MAQIDQHVWPTKIHYALSSPIHSPRGLGGPSHIYTFLSVARPRSKFSHPKSRASLMSSPSSQTLQQLHRLDRSSPDFDRQLHDILSGKEYAQCGGHLESGDSVWLIDYLDEVRPGSGLFPTLRLNQRRLSVVLILPAWLPGNASASSDPYATPRRHFQHHTPCLGFLKLIQNHSPEGVSVRYTKEPLMVRGSALKPSEVLTGVLHRRR